MANIAVGRALPLPINNQICSRKVRSKTYLELDFVTLEFEMVMRAARLDLTIDGEFSFVLVATATAAPTTHFCQFYFS